MVGEGGGATPSSVASIVGGGEWEVEYSRFFNFPTPSSSSLQSSTSGGLLKVLPRAKTRDGGVWITASSLAYLRLPPLAGSDPSPVLSVSIPGVIYEQHFISKLNITWPQVSCTSEVSLGGSRAVLLSFRDCSSQIQKFATRFNTSIEVQAFLEYVKEQHFISKLNITWPQVSCTSEGSLGGSRAVLLSFRDCSSQIQKFAARFNTSIEVQAFFEYVMSSGDIMDLEDSHLMRGNVSPKAASTGIPCRKFVGRCGHKVSAGESISAMAHDAIATELSLQMPNIDSSSRVLPPSFNDLLNRCSSNLSDSVPNANTLQKPISSVAVNNGLVNDAAESSFMDKLAQMEDIIAALGVDMSF